MYLSKCRSREDVHKIGGFIVSLQVQKSKKCAHNWWFYCISASAEVEKMCTQLVVLLYLCKCRSREDVHTIGVFIVPFTSFDIKKRCSNRVRWIVFLASGEVEIMLSTKLFHYIFFNCKRLEKCTKQFHSNYSCTCTNTTESNTRVEFKFCSDNN